MSSALKLNVHGVTQKGAARFRCHGEKKMVQADIFSETWGQIQVRFGFRSWTPERHHGLDKVNKTYQWFILKYYQNPIYLHVIVTRANIWDSPRCELLKGLKTPNFDLSLCTWAVWIQLQSFRRNLKEYITHRRKLHRHNALVQNLKTLRGTLWYLQYAPVYCFKVVTVSGDFMVLWKILVKKKNYFSLY